MNDATHGADNIRNDISALAQRYALIDRDEECGVLVFLIFLVSFHIGKINVNFHILASQLCVYFGLAHLFFMAIKLGHNQIIILDLAHI